MAIVAVDLGSSPTGAGGDTNREAFTKVNTSITDLDGRGLGADGLDGTNGVGVPAGGSTGHALKKASAVDHDTLWAAEAAAITEAVAGGAGFTNVSGVVTMNLTSSRAFHHTMTGSITSLAFSNVPAAAAFEAAWTWALHINATGGYMLSSTPAVTWVDGSDWSDLDLTANAKNEVRFWQVGAVTYAALVWNGDLALDPYTVCFISGQETTVIILTAYEEIGAGGVTKHGDGTITLSRNGGGAITTRTAFDAGDRLGVQLSSGMGTTVAVSIPRYAR